MGRGHNHFDNCQCNWCNSGGHYHTWANEQYLKEFQNIYERIKKIKECFSYTIPNAICPVCGNQVYYYQNSYGSKVFFDRLGKPWPKHNCSSTQELIPIVNDSSIKEQCVFSETYHPTIVVGIKNFVSDFYIITIKNYNHKFQDFVIRGSMHDWGLTFLENNFGKVSLHGYIHQSYEFECFDKNEFIIQNDHLFPYTVGNKIEITLYSKYDRGVRTEIFLDKKISVNQSIKFRCFIYNATLSKSTREEIRKSGLAKIMAKSCFNYENEIIFTECYTK